MSPKGGRSVLAQNKHISMLKMTVLLSCYFKGCLMTVFNFSGAVLAGLFR
jgi:hypothetical protein